MNSKYFISNHNIRFDTFGEFRLEFFDTKYRVKLL